MKFRSGIALFAVGVGLSGLTLCQPPTPRIVRVEAPSYAVVTSTDATAKTVLSSYGPVERATKEQNLDDPLGSSFSEAVRLVSPTPGSGGRDRQLSQQPACHPSRSQYGCQDRPS